LPFTSEPRYLGTLLDMSSSAVVITEVKQLFHEIYPQADCFLFDHTAQSVVDLYRGHYPRYLACNVGFHDLQHTTDTLLALMRLIHGASLSELVLPADDVVVALSAAMLHDTGYIQREEEVEGTGARFGPVHEERSVAFTLSYFRQRGVAQATTELCVALICCTRFSECIEDLPFVGLAGKTLGKMLASADLAGQIADRTYLEKLLFLYREFDEGQMGNYRDEFDLLQKTLEFYSLVDRRLRTDLEDMRRYYRPHFSQRWGIDDDLYASTIERNLDYLHYLLTHHPDDYREKLNRGGLIDQLEALEANDQQAYRMLSAD